MMISDRQGTTCRCKFIQSMLYIILGHLPMIGNDFICKYTQKRGTIDPPFGSFSISPHFIKN